MAETVMSVCWKDHTSELATVYKSLLENNFLVDCTLSAEGQTLKAHRLVLSACSPYFHMLFCEETGKHSFIILLETSFEILKAVIDFVYQGETQISDGNLKSFLALAQSLQIKGLKDFTKNYKSKKPSYSTAETCLQGLSDDKQDACEVQSVHCTHKDSSENYSQYHPCRLDGYADTVYPNSSVAFKRYSASGDKVQSPQEYQIPLGYDEMPVETEITLKQEPLNAAFSETRNDIMDNVKSNEPTPETCMSEVDARNSSSFGEQHFNQNSCYSELSHGKMESPVMVPSQQQLSEEMSCVQDVIEEEEPLQPEILVPKSECVDDDESQEPIYDSDLSENDKNETGQVTEPAHGEQGPDQCSSAADTEPADEGQGTSKSQPAGGEGKRPLTCDVCAASFNFPSHLAIHMRMHTGERPYRCEVCGDSFMRSYDLVTHMRRHTGERPYVCDVCGIAFSQSGTLATHKRTHTGARAYRCSFCGKAFAHKQNLAPHMRTHTGERPFCCNVCGKTFGAAQQFSRHMRTHTGEQKYPCDLCDKAFVAKQHLDRHRRTHTGDRPYRCDVCGKGFAQSGNLAVHKRTHTGERPYRCEVCDMAFAWPGTLATHKLTHTGEIPYRCDVCGKDFTNPTSFARHKKRHAEEGQR
ncbi:hypothetical protein R5R35_004219 [Gryllus longicercus]|uniref:Zinc finger protein n=1 Tax=Gryllus longicercus TaxID=2509291 RepID=A0AAN9ZH23_9ORTH